MKKKLVSVMLCLLLVPMFVVASFYGCNSDESENTAQTKIFYGDDNGEVLHNPYMGWQYYAFPWEVIKFGIPENFDVCCIQTSWDQIETSEGVYDFELLDRAIERLRKDGKTVYFRMYMMPDNVWGFKGYPDWIKEQYPEIAFKKVDFDNINGNGAYSFYHPDYGSATYLRLMENFLKAFTQHFANGVIDIIDMRCYGLYGEWDSGWGNYWEMGADGKYDQTNPVINAERELILNGMVDIFKTAFKTYDRTKIIMNCSGVFFSEQGEYDMYKRIAGYENAMEAGFGVRYDATGTGLNENPVSDGTDFQAFIKNINKDYFPKAPVFSETWYGCNPELYDINQTWEAFKKIRVNSATYGFYKGSYFMVSKDFLEDGLKEMGYRIIPTKIEYSKTATAGGRIEFKSSWINKACGVLYYKYPLCLTLTDSAGKEVYMATRDDFDLTALIMETKDFTYNTQFRLPSSLVKGNYTVKISIVDPSRNNANYIALPLGEHGNTEKSYSIGSIEIL